jgi:hypothetical protein
VCRAQIKSKRAKPGDKLQCRECDQLVPVPDAYAEKSSGTKWIFIGTAIFGLVAAIFVAVAKYYEIQRARAEAARAEVEAERVKKGLRAGPAKKGSKEKTTATDEEVRFKNPNSKKEIPVTKKETPVQESPAIRKPVPVAWWDFKKGTTDSVSGIRGNLYGGAVLANGCLRLNGNSAYMQTGLLPFDLRQRTIEVWLTLANLNQMNVCILALGDSKSLHKGNYGWDGISFAAKTPKKWYPGSAYDFRSRILDGPEEDAKPNDLLHLVMAYRPDNRLTLYRNGKVYGSTFVPAGVGSDLQTYGKGAAFVFFGSPEGQSHFFAGSIKEARLYNRALTEQEIEVLYQQSPK